MSWDSNKQPIVTLSSTEVEYVVATAIACQVVWMRRMLKYLLQNQQEQTRTNKNQQEPATIFCDNNSSIVLSKNHVYHKKTKQFEKGIIL